MFSICTCKNCLCDVPADTVSRTLKCRATRPCDALQLRWINLFLHSFIYPLSSSFLKSSPSPSSLPLHSQRSHTCCCHPNHPSIHPSIVSPPPQNKNPVLTRFFTADCVFQPGATRHDSILFAPSALSHSLCVSVCVGVCVCVSVCEQGGIIVTATPAACSSTRHRKRGGGGRLPSRIHQ